MANIFAYLSVAVLLAAAYVANKNKEMYILEIQARQTAERDLKKSQDRLEDLRSKRDATIDERKGFEAETLVAEKKEDEQSDENAKLQGDIDEKRELVQANKAKINDLKAKMAELGGLSELAGKMKRLGSEIADLEEDQANKDAMLANLRDELNSTGGSIANYKKVSSNISKQKSYFSSTRITGIYGNWGFVTLDAGNTAGVVTGSRLDVVRGGSVVAELQVRSVEAGRSSADIVPDSLAEDTVLMVGDRVVPTTEKEVKPQAAVN